MRADDERPIVDLVQVRGQATNHALEDRIAISLRALAGEGLGPARSLRKVQRILRVHFQRVRSAAIGPDFRPMDPDPVDNTAARAAGLDPRNEIRTTSD